MHLGHLRWSRYRLETKHRRLIAKQGLLLRLATQPLWVEFRHRTAGVRSTARSTGAQYQDPQLMMMARARHWASAPDAMMNVVCRLPSRDGSVGVS
jgi:hypothetical protein